MNYKPVDILEFWFEKAGEEKWHGANAGFDSIIRQRFEKTSNEIAAQLKFDKTHDWLDDKNGSLALILLLNQFPRFMYRGTKGAYAYDELAVQIASIAIDKGHDFLHSQKKRVFYYLPFMHSENIELQNQCVKLVEMRIDNPDILFHAREHRKLIKRFGRFPDRNTVLGRENTSAEQAYLNSGAYLPD